MVFFNVFYAARSAKRSCCTMTSWLSPRWSFGSSECSSCVRDENRLCFDENASRCSKDSLIFTVYICLPCFVDRILPWSYHIFFDRMILIYVLLAPKVLMSNSNFVPSSAVLVQSLCQGLCSVRTLYLPGVCSPRTIFSAWLEHSLV